MSYDIDYYLGPPCKECGHFKGTRSWDPTYNYGKMFRAAFGGNGVHDFNGMTGRDAVERLSVGIKDMKARPEYYKTFDSDNGWGVYGEDIIQVLEDILKTCREYPNGVFTVT